jgi:hypothetical protein
MMKLIRHKWKMTGFNTWKCTDCGCEKQHVSGIFYFYFRSGVQLPRLPECKKIFHCDKMMNN